MNSPQSTEQPGRNVIEPASFSPASATQSKPGLRIRPATVLVALVLMISAVIGWYLFTAKSVVINTQPGYAALDVSGGFSFKLGDHYLMREGQYRLRAEATGYYSLDEPLVVGEAQNQIRDYALTKLPGHLTINSDPANIVEVWIDGELAGTTAKQISEVAAGERQLRFTAPRYRDLSQAVTVDGMDKQQSLDVALDPAWADVVISSDPVGAEVFSDGEKIGLTPMTAELLEGKRELSISLVGYKSWQQQLKVTAGDGIELPPVVLEKADGRKWVRSKPSGAGVTVNGNYFGQTPIELTLAPADNYTLTLFKDGFQPASRDFPIASGDNSPLAVTLGPVLGDIKIVSRHKDALLYLDGRLMGRANQTLSLPAREFEIRVSKTGYVDYVRTLVPKPSLAQQVTVRLKTLEQAKWESIKPVIQLADGQVLKLFKPKVTFTMGASRREQGRRSNETLHQVRLERPFYLATKEITNAQFRRFQRQHTSSHVKGNSLNGDRYPVVNVSWQQAALFCNWLSEQSKLPPFYRVEDNIVVGVNAGANGYRLPTEAEWSWAARYEDGAMNKYAWGKQLPPTPGSGNFADRSGAALLGNIQARYDDKFPVTAPVGSFNPNAKGLYDLAGNVAEWINDFYEIKSARIQKPPLDPIGKDRGDFHVIRGSSWSDGTMTDLRMAFREYGNDGRNDLGFRIARYVEAKPTTATATQSTEGAVK